MVFALDFSQLLSEPRFFVINGLPRFFDFGQKVFVIVLFFCFLHKNFHSLNTRFIKRFKNIHGCKQESARAAGGVEDGNRVERFVEMAQEIGVGGVFNRILRKLADVQVVRNKIVYLVNFAVINICFYFGVTVAAVNHFAPYFGRQGIFRRSGFVPCRAAFKKFRVGSIETN